MPAGHVMLWFRPESSVCCNKIIYRNGLLRQFNKETSQSSGTGNEQKRKSTKQVHSPSPKMKVKVKKRISVPDEDQCQTEESFSSATSSRISAVSSDSFNGEITSSVTAMKSPKKRRKSKQSLPEPDESWEKAVERARGMPDGALGGADAAGDGGEDGPTQKIKKAGDKVKKMPLNILQTAAKKLKLSKSSGKSPEQKEKGTKRKSTEDSGKGENKKPKMDEMPKKERKKQRRMQKDNYEMSAKAKDLWNALRRHELTTEKRLALCTELHTTVKGKALQLIFAHDTSRVIQCLIKYGSAEHKSALFEELREHLLEMTKSKYAKFFVRKLLKYGTKAQRNYVFRSMYGSVRKLIRHKEAAEIIECAYNNYANAQQRAALVEEFYGPSFALFKTSETRTLDDIMKSHPEKRVSVLSNMKEVLSALVDKTVLQYSIIHRIFLEFFNYASVKQRTEMIETVREGIVHMLHTRDGARVGMICLWHGTAKDRKVIVKSFKTFVAKICQEEYGHLVLLALFDVVDDTKLVQKAILDELLKGVHDLAQDGHGRKVLYYLLCGRHPLHFHPDIIKVLQQGDGNATSKKDAAVRRRELLDHMSKPLVQYLVKCSDEIVLNNATILLMVAVLTHAKCDPTEAMRAVAQIAAEPFAAGNQQTCHIVEHSAGHLSLKKLIANDANRMKDGEKIFFSRILLDVLPKGALKTWAACNRGCFILISLLEVNDEEVTTRVKEELVSVKKSITKMDFKGAQILLTKLTTK
ncbi:pumilio RNA binding family member 3 [Lamellibrachia satsuma]|nr:pumilio RNA binding family member 3 [Lamellibrachia satsuma]